VSCASAARAADQRFNDWSVGFSDSGTSLYAATVNDSGEVLGEYCDLDSKKCHWLLGMETECDEGDEYPLLANTSSGARHLMATCFKDIGDGQHVYAFDWREIEAVIKGAKWVGLAFPMAGDAFKVVRFSLSGIDDSTRFMEAAFKRALEAGSRPSPEKPQGTKTQIL
jgi:hypothetical protein